MRIILSSAGERDAGKLCASSVVPSMLSLAPITLSLDLLKGKMIVGSIIDETFFHKLYSMDGLFDSRLETREITVEYYEHCLGSYI